MHTIYTMYIYLYYKWGKVSKAFFCIYFFIYLFVCIIFLVMFIQRIQSNAELNRIQDRKVSEWESEKKTTKGNYKHARNCYTFFFVVVVVVVVVVAVENFIFTRLHSISFDGSESEKKIRIKSTWKYARLWCGWKCWREIKPKTKFMLIETDRIRR